MSLHEDKLKAISTQLKRGVAPSKETVRTFLGWFYAERRGYNVVRRIRRELARHRVATSPDFEYQYIDGPIGFVIAPEQEDSAERIGRSASDPTYHVGRLEAANRKPTTIKPDSTLRQAITIMMDRDFSQLPVMPNDRDVKGVVTWKTIGRRLALCLSCDTVRDCMEPPEVVSLDSSLFSAIDKVAEHDYVLVQAKDKTICGIVTASDFNDQWRKLAEPFLLVGEIERGVRQILHGKFSTKELGDAKAASDDGRVIEGVADLSFGEYIRLISPDKHWQRLNLAIDRAEFTSRLDKIRLVRNDVMHFDPDGLEPSDLATLREFAKFLKTLRDVGAV